MQIIPAPQKFVKINGTFSVDAQTKVFCHNEFLGEIQPFCDYVKSNCGFDLVFTENIEEAHVIFNHNVRCLDGQYLIMINQGVATVSASDKASCFYAVQSLLKQVRVEDGQISVNNCYVEDRPVFAHRGLLLDVCRHFFGVETVKKVIDLMATFKLNKLHLHLSDDQGFRVEISKYPLLNTVGSHRGGSEVVSGGKRFVDETPHGGYYTKADVAEIVSYAASKHIDVIPEIDVPGHAVAMIASYPWLSCTGQVAEVRKRWGISKDILCAGNDDTLAFVCDVLDEVAEMFPSEYIHLGGDEVPKDRWCNCKLCRQKVADLRLSGFDELQTYFVEQIRLHLQQKGKKVICWNDGISGADENVVSQVWKPKTLSKAKKQANNGRKTILSPFFNMYFDYPYAMTPLSKTYAFKPLCGIKKSAKSNVLGVEGALWTEYVASEEKLFFNLLPRLCALAEVAWGYKRCGFTKRVKGYYPLFEQNGLTYNAKATRGKCLFARISKTKAFFNKDADVELTK